MGEENDLPTVEESTEPPIRAQQSSRNHGKASACQHAEPQPSDRDGGASQLLPAPHTLAAAQVADALNVVVTIGLDTVEAERRLLIHGPNVIHGAEGLSLWKLALRQVSNSLTLVLVITMGLSFGISDYIEGGVIAAVIILNICVGFYQDYNAEKTLQSLQKMAAPEARVLRGGKSEVIRAADLVIGDVVNLNMGAIVPADLRLIDGVNAFTDEAFLTGESLSVEKTPAVTFGEMDLPTGDRTNLAFSGSVVTLGRCSGIVVATGPHTEVGKIAEMLHQTSSPRDRNSNAFIRIAKRVVKTGKVILGLEGTPLQITLSKFALLLFALAILLAIIVFSANKWQVGGEILIYGICVAVAVIPESLIAVLTITIAVGAKEMANAQILTRKSSAIEAIGGVTNICSDKTGTLTTGKMIVKKAQIDGIGTLSVDGTTDSLDPGYGIVKLDQQHLDLAVFNPPHTLATFIRTIALCNLAEIFPPSNENVQPSSLKQSDADTNSSIELADTFTRPSTTSTHSGEWTANGESTDIALQVLAMRFGMGKAKLLDDPHLVHVAEFPFDSTLKRMTVVYKDNSAGHLNVYSKGATEFLVPLLNISRDERARILRMADTMAADGLRVLCVAHKILPLTANFHKRETVETTLDYLGLVAIYDPPRPETAGAIRECQTAGITVHMVTGDHPGTALSIAREVGILDGTASNVNAGTAVMLAKDFESMSDEEVDKMQNLPLVIARCSPTSKVKMVDALHRRKKFCVMTGDGVNDSPALKRSDVGVAMGNGSDVAKEASEMVLTDENFASIVKAVREGRRLFDNIQKFLMHLLISNIAQVILLLTGLAFKDQDGHSVFPLSPIEILWANLITSSFLAIGLGLEESQPDNMFRPPHSLKVGVFTKELIVDKFIYGFFMGSLCLASFSMVAYAGPGGGNLGRGCNEDWHEECRTVYRARATTYATLTLLLLVTAWEVKHFARSLFNLYPDSRSPPGLSIFPSVWRNRFLFWSVVAGFTLMFPIIYIPVINQKVFKHEHISWEWGVSASCVAVYVGAIESWKAVKRGMRFWSGKNKVITKEDAEARAGLQQNLITEK